MGEIGGENDFFLTTFDELEGPEFDVVKLVKKNQCGAIATFYGTTRDTFHGNQVIHLEYSAYEPLVKKQLGFLSKKLRSLYSIEALAVIHRLGVVKVGEMSISIGVSSPHRQDSLRALDFVIEYVKQHLAVWKKEVFLNREGQVESTWKRNANR